MIGVCVSTTGREASWERGGCGERTVCHGCERACEEELRAQRSQADEGTDSASDECGHEGCEVKESESKPTACVVDKERRLKV